MDELKEERLKRPTKKKTSHGEKPKNKKSQPSAPKKKRRKPRNQDRNSEETLRVKSDREDAAALSKEKMPPRKKKRKKLTKEEIEKRRKKKRKDNIIEIIKFMLPVVIFAIIVFFFILNTSPHMVDGDSMNPTLSNKDRVIVRRTKDLQRYEVITFKPPVDSEYQYVKRIIGMPGDTIWTEGSDLFINHQAEELPDVSELSAATELPDGTIKVNISEKALEQLSQLDKIPDNHYFVLGDNRNNSSDSRAFGLVDGQAVEGVVSFRYAPFDHIGWIK